MAERGMKLVRECQPGVSLLAVGLIAMGVLSVLCRDFAYSWQPVPEFPGRQAAAVVCGLFMIVASIGLLFRATVAASVRGLFPFLVAWLCLKVPALFLAPRIEGVWLGAGEITMLLAGGWVLFARFSGLENAVFFRKITGNKGVRVAQIVFGLAVLPVGLSHLFYSNITAMLVPSWLPVRMGFAYLTGIGQMACGLAILATRWRRVAALIETGMLALFAFLVWGPYTWFAATPKMAGAPPGARFPLTAFLITWVIGASALLVASDGATKTVERFNSKLDRGTRTDLAESPKEASR
jgi:uncharacterized membrane protein